MKVSWIKDVSGIIPVNRRKKLVKMASEVDGIVIHCVGSPVPLGRTASGAATAIARYHTGPNHISEGGLHNICYHFVVGQRGDVVQTLPFGILGWHAKSFSKHCLGVLLDFSGQGSPPESQVRAAIELCGLLCSPGIVPGGEKDGIQSSSVKGHKELPNANKPCPGAWFTPEKANWFRSEVKEVKMRYLKEDKNERD